MNEEKKQLTNTLLEIVRPKVVESAPQELNLIQQTSALFSRRRAAIEAKDREEAKILKQSTNLGKPDDRLREVEVLETELGIEKEA